MDERAPLLLALSSAAGPPGAAVLEGGRLLARSQDEDGTGPGSSLLPRVEEALARAGIELARVEAFAVAIGPGSFTGLRVGLATVKGLAFGAQQPVVPVSTLLAVAEDAGEAAGDLLRVPLLDARRGAVYGCALRAGAGGSGYQEVLPEALYRPEELLERLPGPACLMGEGAGLLPDPLPEGVARHTGSARPDAAAVGRLGARLLAAGGGRPAAGLVPRYLQRARAEALRAGDAREG